jgi:integrase
MLTGQRLGKVASLRWEDVSVDGIWTIPTEDREKGNAGKLPLPEIALNIIKAQPHFAENPYVLAGRGKTHFRGFSKAKAAFDAKVPIEHWTLHDLRRTARSLMSRAGVLSEHAERVLGHTIKGVEGTYDRHTYTPEKAQALKKLAGLIDTIVNPPADNGVSFGGAQ